MILGIKKPDERTEIPIEGRLLKDLGDEFEDKLDIILLSAVLGLFTGFYEGACHTTPCWREVRMKRLNELSSLNDEVRNFGPSGMRISYNIGHFTGKYSLYAFISYGLWTIGNDLIETINRFNF